MLLSYEEQVPIYTLTIVPEHSATVNPVAWKDAASGMNGYQVLALNESAWVALSCDVVKPYVTMDRSEKGNPTPEKDGDTCNDQPVDQSLGQESLDHLPPVYVDPLYTLRGQLADDVSRRARHALDVSGQLLGYLEFPASEHYHALVAVRPGAERPRDFEGVPPHHEGVDPLEKFLVSIVSLVARALAGREPVDTPIFARDEAVEARRNEHGRVHVYHGLSSSLKEMNMLPEAPSHYEALGGDAGIRRLVDRFYDLMDESPEATIVRGLHATNLKSSREKLYLFLSGWTGGPQKYVELYGHPRLRMRHLPFSIGTVERDQWLWCMEHALDEHEIPVETREHLRASFRALADHMRNRVG